MVVDEEESGGDEFDGRRSLLAEVAREGGERALESFREVVTVETKEGPLDSVTEVDRAVQRHVADRVADAFPDDALVGEEDGAEKEIPETGYAWVVDPIDGTNNYVAGNRNWTTSVALVRDGAVVGAVNRAPALGESYVALGNGSTRSDGPCTTSDRADLATFTVDPVFGLSPAHRTGLAAVTGVVANRLGDLRRVGSGQLTLSMVAAGELDAAVSTVSLPPWDTRAGVYLVREAGGVVTDLAGERWTGASESLLVSNGRAHDELVEAFGGL
ncbi:inositol monophosphatase family protein [Halobium salinum]|uniref:fructose-bisphosphatase n=1 Tax=Halobium salinum TaxID=1364940 RepID=A0ABD5PGP5_9EURY|nr:inositol monophosphatase [Halobium salinum]